MEAILIRVGVDQTYEQWNAPVDPESGHFVYVPIPEKRASLPGLERSYREVLPSLQRFALRFELDLESSLGLPRSLLDHTVHLAACGESRSSSPLVIGEGIDRIDPAPYTVAHGHGHPATPNNGRCGLPRRSYQSRRGIRSTRA